jgi:hypothetical protein
VALEPMGDVVVLLEVPAQREVEERAAGCGQLHRGGEPAVADSEVAGRQMPVQLVHVAARLGALAARQRARVDARARDEDHAQARNAPLGFGERGRGALEQVDPRDGTAGRDDADLLVVAVGELGAQARAVGGLGGVESSDVAGEPEMLARPVGDRRQTGPEALGDQVLGVADEDRSVAQPRTTHVRIRVPARHRGSSRKWKGCAVSCIRANRRRRFCAAVALVARLRRIRARRPPSLTRLRKQ